ncbi:MAG: hypothetical protein J0H71_05345 [Rhizobiales bacterium]|nr:hypothetical protein [Hyphomicrobiales bacterium]
MRRRRDEPITIERLERALALVSWMMLEDGPAWTPYFERLESEIAAMRARDDAMSRARRYLDLQATSASDGVRAIA